MRQICLDTETTGLNADKDDRIVEIGCAEIVGRTLSDRPEAFFHRYINPERDVPIEAVDVHGLDNAFLADKPIFADIVDDFLKIIEGAELIIHNASFDVGFLNMELGRLGKGRIEDYCLKVTDSLKMASDMFPGLRNNLDVLCSRYEIDSSARTLHGALLDARLLAEVYLAMTRKQGELLSDTIEAGENGFQIPDKSLFVRATVPADEMAEHEAFLERIAKKSKKGCLWTLALQPQEQTPAS